MSGVISHRAVTLAALFYEKKSPGSKSEASVPPNIGTQAKDETDVISRKSNQPEKAHPTNSVRLALPIFVIAFFIALPFSFVLQVAIKFLHTVCIMQ